ncbi:hypothetical protein [Actibacterium sp.]|uniref:hypothetical protein n=1 Tax=Actibacterium sp. TaxID=1872125 RepID=UPI0035690B19
MDFETAFAAVDPKSRFPFLYPQSMMSAFQSGGVDTAAGGAVMALLARAQGEALALVLRQVEQQVRAFGMLVDSGLPPARGTTGDEARRSPTTPMNISGQDQSCAPNLPVSGGQK